MAISEIFQLWCFDNITIFMFVYLIAVIVLVVAFLLAKAKYDNQSLSYKGVLYHKHCRLSQFLLHKWTALEEHFRPTFWAANAHIQTLLYLLWPTTKVRFRREYLLLEDQGVLALDWSTTNEHLLDTASAVLIIIPGLTCGINEVSLLCSRAHEYSFRYVVFNRRGHGGSVLTTACLQNSFQGKDLEEAILYIHNVYPCAKMCAVAYSSGSALLLSYLEESKKAALSGAVCISPNYEMEKGLENGLPPLYDYLMTKRLIRLLKQHPGLSSVIDYESAMKSCNIREFNERVYEPLLNLNGYRSGAENMANNNFNNVTRIRVPTLCISALDDPICSEESIPYSLFKNSSNFFLITCEKGGHCGFMQGDTNLHSWADHLACTFLDAMVHFNMKKPVENSPFFFTRVTRDRSYTQ